MKVTKQSRDHLFAGVAAAAVLCAAASASAEAQPPAKTSSDQPVTIGEVVVTAQKRSQSLEKTPLSVGVVNGDVVAKQGDVQLDEALSKVGAVRVLEGQDGPTFYIRGVGTGVPSNISDPEVNLNVDGVYQSEPEYSRSGLYDVNRIEVLRGPQGALYGRNALAGAVNIVTNDPTQSFGAAVSAGFGSYSLVQVQGMANLPITDQLAARLAFGTESHSGYLSNGADDADVQSERLKLLWKPSERFSLLLAADNTHEGGAGEGEVQVVAPPAGFPTGTSGLANSLKSSNPWTSPDPAGATRSTDFWSVRAEANLDLGFGVLTVLPAYRSYDYTCLSCWRSETDQNNYADEHQSTVEARLGSEKSSKVEWVLGVYYLDANNPSHYQQLGPGADDFSNNSGNAVSVAGQTRYTSQSYAVFGQLTYPLTDRFRVTLGGRYSNDKKAETGYVSSETGGVTTSTTGLFSSSASWDNFSYHAGVEFDVTKSWMLYASTSTGFKDGGFYQGAAPNAFSPEHLTAYEIGSKGDYLDGRLLLNVDVFYYDYKDYQVNYIGVINPTADGIFGILTANAPGATSYGAEIEGRYLITPDDQFDFSIDPLHARFGTLAVGGFFGGTYSHDPLPFAPAMSTNLGYQHSWRTADRGKFTFRVETHLESATWVTFNEATNTRQPAYSRTNLFLTWDAPNANWSVTAYGKNLENAAVLANGQSGPAGLETVDLMPPRTYGVQVSARF